MAAGDLRVYDADQIHVSIAGITCQGYGEDEFLTIERDSDSFSDVVGTDGEVSRSKTNDERATATLKLMQTSPTNELLSTLHNLDKMSPGGAGVGPFLVRDKQGTTIHSAEKCWIQKSPDNTWGRTATEREWPIRLAKLVSFDGSNT